MKLANDDIDRPRTPTKNMDEMKGNQNGLMSATNSSSKRRIISYDRFIPDRTSVDYSVIHHLNSDTFGSPTRKKNINGEYDAVKEEASKVYSQILRNELLGSPLSNAMQLSSPSKILQYRPPNDKRSNSTFRSTSNICIDSPQNEKYSISPITPISQKALLSPRKTPRHISKVPFKVLDAPELADDFYLNLVDWGLSNVLAVGLGTSVYLWSACTSRVTRLCDIGPYDAITSVNWIQRGNQLAVGTNKGLVQLWDASKCKRIRSMTGHSARVGALAWNDNILSSGSRDKFIYHRDTRSQEHYIKKIHGHKQEVCGLKWNEQEQQLASGGNDNKLFIWDRMNDKALLKFNEHSAAVKAIAWSPHSRGLLSSGGGTADRKIRFWNTISGNAIQCIDTGSQVCNLAWSKNSDELVSTHGYSQNQIVVWKYPSMQQITTLHGHTLRVLYLASSPDGQTIVTGAGDETLRFWNVFNKIAEKNEGESLLNSSSRSIR